MTWTFHVDGTPTAQGSVKAITRAGGHANIVHANPIALRSWRQDIAARARDAGVELTLEPVTVRLVFRLQRPASVTEKRRPFPSVKPDLDKLARAVLDALTGITYRDDAQVVRLDTSKVYADRPGLTCTIGRAVWTDCVLAQAVFDIDNYADEDD